MDIVLCSLLNECDLGSIQFAWIVRPLVAWFGRQRRWLFVRILVGLYLGVCYWRRIGI